MKKLNISETDLEVSEMCLGCLPFSDRAKGEAGDRLIRLFLDNGGNFFDTAHCYSFWVPHGEGASERHLGAFVHTHCKRGEVIIATKGGHPGGPNYRSVDDILTPGRVAADIDDRLARLRTDYLDLYWLHRDDPRKEVGYVLAILNEEVKRGRIRYFGGSNWTSQRLAEANQYAVEKGIQGFFALGTGGPREFQNEPSLQRLERVRQCAKELNASPNQIALAWLKHQPFPRWIGYAGGWEVIFEGPKGIVCSAEKRVSSTSPTGTGTALQSRWQYPWMPRPIERRTKHEHQTKYPFCNSRRCVAFQCLWTFFRQHTQLRPGGQGRCAV